MTKIVTSFTAPGGQVALLPWPLAVRPDTGSTHAGGAPRDAEDVAQAAAVIDAHDRTARVLQLAPGAVAEVPAPGPTGMEHGRADLVVTSLRPRRGVRACDRVAAVAAQLLRPGGVFAVLTYCDWNRGELVDPSGPMITAAQNADLLYLQHLIAVHAPTRSGVFKPDAITTPLEKPLAQQRVRNGPVSSVRHRRIHSDVLMFACSHRHTPLPPVTPSVQKTGGVR